MKDVSFVWLVLRRKGDIISYRWKKNGDFKNITAIENPANLGSRSLSEPMQPDYNNRNTETSAGNSRDIAMS